MSTLLDAPPRRPATPPAVTTGRVILAIARVEGVRLLRHPATLIGAVLATALAATHLRTRLPVLQRDVLVFATCALLIGAGVLVAASLAASRVQRDDLVPLTTVLPSTDVVRTLGVLVGLAWPAVAAVGWAAVGTVLLAAADGVGRPAVGDLLAPAGTVLLAGTIGAAVGRWVPRALTGIVTLLVVGFALMVVWARWALGESTGGRLLPWADWSPGLSGGWIELWPRQPLLHLTWVVLLAVVLAGMAVLRDRRSVTVVVVVVAGVGAAALVAQQLLEVWDDQERVAALARDLREPEHRLRCTAADGVEVCLPNGYERWEASLRAPTRAALDVLPEGALGPLRVELASSSPYDLLRSVEAVAPGSGGARDDLVELVELATQLSWGGVLGAGSDGAVRASAARLRGQAGETQRLDLVLGVVAEATGMPLRERPGALLRDESLAGAGADAGAGSGGSGTGEQDPWETTLGYADGCAPALAAPEVLTFALAVAADPTARAALERALQERPYGWVGPDGPRLFGAVAFDDQLWLPGGVATVPDHGAISLGGPVPPWSLGAATLGLALADAASVAELHVEWDRWVDPVTPAEDLLDAFGVDPLPSPAQLAIAAGITDHLGLFDPRCLDGTEGDRT